MDKNFLLESESARRLYHDYAAEMPIYDYHCHINVDEIRSNKQYENITQVWLYGDHYKWRAMRLCGVDEHYITGSASDYDRFLAYAGIMPMLIGNPIYHWTHLELREFFGITEPLNKASAEQIWERTKEKLTSGYSVRDMMRQCRVKKLCSTDDPIDSLEDHRALREEEGLDFSVMPSFRPDKGVEILKEEFLPWIEKLGRVCDTKIQSFSELLACFDQRIDFFQENGCCVADHGLDGVHYADSSQADADAALKKVLAGKALSPLEAAQYKTVLMSHLARRYRELGWVMQLHIGAMRSNNRIMKDKLGPDTGFDSINDYQIAENLSRLLDRMNDGGLPKTLLYTLNPKDNSVLGTMMGNFPEAGYGSRVQFGCAWWFNDHIDGMLEHMKCFANLGVLPKFVGMLTDSRSFLSYTRHDYFRRILCNFFGDLVESGQYPNDIPTLGKMVQNIAYNNAVEFIAGKKEV